MIVCDEYKLWSVLHRAPKRKILKEYGEHNVPKTGIYYFRFTWYFLKINNGRVRVEEVLGWPNVGST